MSGFPDTFILASILVVLMYSSKPGLEVPYLTLNYLFLPPANKAAEHQHLFFQVRSQAFLTGT